MTTIRVRPAIADDAPAIGDLAERAGLFPATMLPDMIASYLQGEAGDRWFVAEDDQGVAGFLYSAPEMLTDGTHNLRAMATSERARRQGVGTALIEALEETLEHAGQRVLLVETSSAEAYLETRGFYRNRGFQEEARIRHFWAKDDHKVVFWKSVERNEPPSRPLPRR